MEINNSRAVRKKGYIFKIPKMKKKNETIIKIIKADIIIRSMNITALIRIVFKILCTSEENYDVFGNCYENVK